MEKTFWGNDAAYNNLVNYVRMEHPAPLILLGKRGLGKKEAALSVASQILATGKEKFIPLVISSFSTKAVTLSE